jgi:hypothetical protein
MSKPRFTSWQTPVRVVTAVAAVAAIALPLTARTQADASATQLYQQERADCMAGRTTQSRADCLYEARSVLRDRRAGALEPGDTASDTSLAATSSYDTGSADELPPRADRN